MPARSPSPEVTEIVGTVPQDLRWFLKAAGDDTRLAILLTIPEGATRTFTELQSALGLKSPGLSHHLKPLLKAGLVLRYERENAATYALSRYANRCFSALLEASAATPRIARLVAPRGATISSHAYVGGSIRHERPAMSDFEIGGAVIEVKDTKNTMGFGDRATVFKMRLARQWQDLEVKD